MIQRIQTVYLFMAVMLTAITFFTPQARFATETPDAYYTLYGLTFQEFGLPPYSGTLTHPWGMIFFALLYIFIVGFTIFCYKSRLKQLRLIRIAYGMLCGYYFSYVAYCNAFATNSETHYVFSLCSLLPLLAWFLTWMAAKAIRRDDALVRAADRIR